MPNIPLRANAAADHLNYRHGASLLNYDSGIEPQVVEGNYQCRNIIIGR